MGRGSSYIQGLESMRQILSLSVFEDLKGGFTAIRIRLSWDGWAWFTLLW